MYICNIYIYVLYIIYIGVFIIWCAYSMYLYIGVYDMCVCVVYMYICVYVCVRMCMWARVGCAGRLIIGGWHAGLLICRWRCCLRWVLVAGCVVVGRGGCGGMAGCS